MIRMIVTYAKSWCGVVFLGISTVCEGDSFGHKPDFIHILNSSTYPLSLMSSFNIRRKPSVGFSVHR